MVKASKQERGAEKEKEWDENIFAVEMGQYTHADMLMTAEEGRRLVEESRQEQSAHPWTATQFWF